ncbi:hypothetical protein BDY19DRAFT_919093 [Irpex rosettiformis]|uniref:Uncharacterized protein n=1 Tax=Irpex rosettiformis TaxID=378272 RepID=A0ACB8UHP0_9APHY|nr:hypothetical protein BDY19DRAFT_919093 [Irpex rosettiformis]
MAPSLLASTTITTVHFFPGVQRDVQTPLQLPSGYYLHVVPHNYHVQRSLFLPGTLLPISNVHQDVRVQEQTLGDMRWQ